VPITSKALLLYFKVCFYIVIIHVICNVLDVWVFASMDKIHLHQKDNSVKFQSRSLLHTVGYIPYDVNRNEAMNRRHELCGVFACCRTP